MSRRIPLQMHGEIAAPVLEVQRLCVSYNATPVLSDLSFDVRRGEIFGVLGSNGAGKSTLMKAMTGLLAPDAGTACVMGYDCHHNALLARRHFGYVISPELLPHALTGAQYLRMIASIRRCTLDSWPLSRIDHRMGLTPWIDKPVGTYSLGTRAKLSIAAALLGAPELLIFDESLNGLDPIASFEVKKMLEELRAMGFAIVLTTHVLEIAANLCDRMILLSNGHLAVTWNHDEMSRARKNVADFERMVVEAIRNHQPSSG